MAMDNCMYSFKCVAGVVCTLHMLGVDGLASYPGYSIFPTLHVNVGNTGPRLLKDISESF